jgi:hypothetical protein
MDGDKRPCKPENVLGKIPFLSKSKPNQFPNRQTKDNTKKSGTPTTELVNLK